MSYTDEDRNILYFDKTEFLSYCWYYVNKYIKSKRNISTFLLMLDSFIELKAISKTTKLI